MGGVMRAVARGHRQAETATHLTHVEPGWGRAWERNPHPASIVRTGLGTMRNHIVVRSADLVVALAGGAGTLSELALAWQEGKPIAVLQDAGGWGSATGRRRLGPPARLGHYRMRRGGRSGGMGDEAPPGGRLQGVARTGGFYPHEVPALHRVHRGEPRPVERVHLRYGMSVEYADLTRRLQELNETVERWNVAHDVETVALVTFDDGWKDVTELATVFEVLPCLCPVLFVGENHFGDSVRPLPLQRLYQHCAEHGFDPEDDVALGAATRSSLKTMSEKAQHAALDRIGIPPMDDPPWLLAPSDIENLKGSGWIVASPRRAS